jgi:hypothetical protein
MTQEMRIKREELKGISRIIQQAVKSGVYDSVNDGLAAMYAEQGHTELHSYRQWREKGFQVRRGSKALLFWGEPRTAQNHDKKTEKDKDEFSFWPLAYVFSQLQVEPVETAVMRQ